LSVKNIQHRFEQLINGLSIKEGKKKYLKNQVNYIKNKIKKVSKWALDFKKRMGNMIGILD